MFKNVGSTWILNALQIASVLVLSPWVLHHLGDDVNGLWVTIVSFTGILSLFILGVPMASVRFIAEAAARKDAERVDRAVSTCLAICVGLGAAALVVGSILWFVFDAGYLDAHHAAALPAGAVDDARLAFGVVVVQVALGFALRLPYGILDAHHDFVARNAVMAGEIVLRFALTLGLVAWRPRLETLAAIQVACSMAEFAAALAVVKRRHPRVRFSLAAFDRTLVRSILGFSVFALLLNLGALLAFRMDAIVISAHLPLDRATWFDVGNKFFDPLTSLFVAVGAVVMPMATRLQATGDVRELRATFLKWSKISLSIALVVGLYLLVLGPAFLGAWMGAEFFERSGLVLQVLMLSFLVYLPVRGVGLPILMGLGKPRGPALALLATGVVNLVLSIALVRPFGIVGVALGTAIPNVLFAAYVLHLACRELEIPVSEWLGYVVQRAAIGALVPLGFLVALRSTLDPRSMAALLASGVAMVLVFGATWVLFVHRGDPHLDALAALRARSGGAR